MRRTARTRGSGPDGGASFVELLIAIVLLGMSVIAILAAVRATVIASRIDSEKADAHEWLQAAADRLADADRVPCATTALDPGLANQPGDWLVDGDAVRAAYEPIVAATPAPAGLTGMTIHLVGVEFPGRAAPGDPLSWSASHCLEGVQDVGGEVQDFRRNGFSAQRVTLEVRDLDGTVVASLDTVKGDL